MSYLVQRFVRHGIRKTSGWAPDFFFGESEIFGVRPSLAKQRGGEVL